MLNEDLFEDLNSEDLFLESFYPKTFEKIRTSKQKEAIIYQGFYYNHLRDKKTQLFLNAES